MKTIAGVPESLTRAQYLSLIESVGFDIKHLRSLEYKYDGIYAEVFDVNEAGNHYTVLGAGTEEDIAMHRVFIPVRDE
jgi:hypothetical protein